MIAKTMNYIEIEHRIEGFCKKVPRKDRYRYPATPAMVYRLVKAGYIEWADYPEMREQFDNQRKANRVAKDYYGTTKTSSSCS